MKNTHEFTDDAFAHFGKVALLTPSYYHFKINRDCCC